jgi:2',3'-cyclic-nucleotide 2'-phosphodiesterase/3'-nucleotidase
MNRKKLLSLLLSLVMALSLAVPAMADGAPWYAEAQEFVTQAGLMANTANGFDPDGAAARDAVLSALYILEGKPTSKAGDTDAVWAATLPDADLSDNVTRGEAKSLLEGYAASRGFDGSGLFLGNEKGDLQLDKTLTRAELAQLLLRLSKKGVPTYTEVMDLQVLATSDLHGKFYPWSYATNSAATSGSLTQLATAIKELRTENTLVVDAGDTIQDNSAQIFNDEPIHPMMLALNAMDYDVWVTGNHEYNFGMDNLKKVIASFTGKALVGNVLDEDGKPIADAYTIIEKNGVKIGVIGMVTQNITRWDAVNLAKCTVKDPVEESRKVIDQIKGDVDVLIAVMHMGVDNEYDVANSGVTDLANACPEFDLIVSSHEHALIEGKEINNILVIQNKNQAQTMNEIHLYLAKSANGWDVLNRTSKAIEIKNYESDADMLALLAPYHETAIADANVVIGKLEGGNLAPDNEIKEIPSAQIMDTALIDLINEVQMYYTDAPVSAAALFVMDANLKEGDIHKSDSSLVYKYDNTLYKLQMTGKQLKLFMEWSASYYNQYQPGDLTISFNPSIRAYNYDMFAGVNYEVDVSKPAGERIVNLTWPDGTPVKDDDSFVIAVNNYRCNSHLLSDSIYKDGDKPVLLEMDVRGDIGGVRELIGEYIKTVKGGTITPVCDNNWKIVGNDWDEALHQKAVEQLAAGLLTIPASEDGRTPNVKAITVDDLK